MKLRDYQKKAVNDLWDHFRERRGNAEINPLIVAPTGCHERDYQIMMSTGKCKSVQNICIGDVVMGVNGQHRTVTSAHSGTDKMYKIKPAKGDSYIVNAGHILSLYITKSGNRWKSQESTYINISVSDYISKSKWFKHRSKLYKSSITFSENPVPIKPWVMGFLLGDGALKSITPIVTICDLDDYLITDITNDLSDFDISPALKKDNSNRNSKEYSLRRHKNSGSRYNKLTLTLKKLNINVLSGDKFIPDCYKFNSDRIRNDILSGLLDSDGHLSKGSCFDFISKSKQLSDDVVFLARSLGLSAYSKKCIKGCQNNFTGTYYRVSISGNLDILNLRSKRRKPSPRKQIKNNLVTGFSAEYVGIDRYYGFSLDGDNLYLGYDFTVHHNSGKSLILSAITRDMLERFGGMRVLIVTHQKELIQQNYEKMLAIYPESEPGIYSSSLKRKQTDNKVLFCGIQSVWKRAHELGDFTLMIVDEAHSIPVKGNGMYRQFIIDMRKYCKKIYVVGLTASPFRLSHGYLHRGEGALFTDIAVDIPVADLIEQGYLTKLTTKQTSITIDTSQVKKRGGEFINSELESAADDVTEAALNDAIKRIQGRKTGLIFCVTIKHAQHSCEYFKELGINCGIITGRTPAPERDEQLNNLKLGKIDCLANVNCLTTGVDVPNIDYIIMLRPTESPGLYLQMCGRGMRLYPGKMDCLVLDYAGNIQRHGCIDALVINQKKPGEKGKAPVKTCPECDSVVHAALLECPDCGYQFPPPEMKIDHEAHQGAILLKDYEPEWFEVSDVKYSRHEGKNGKPDTMRVDYYRDGGLFPVRICSEFICIYHDSGFPRKSAKRWLRRFNDTLDIDDLIVSNANDVLAKPKKILVNTTFKYPKIMDYHI